MNKSKVNIAIVVLADNEDTVLDYPKPMLPWGNSTLLGHAIKEAVKTQINDLYVVLGHQYESIFERHKHFPVHYIKNPKFQDGLFTGVLECLKWISKTNVEGIMFIYGDQPQVDHQYLKHVLHSFLPSTQSIVATKKDQELDFPMIIDKTYFKAIQELESNHSEFQNLLTQNKEKIILLSPTNNFEHVTDKQDYDKLHQDWFGEMNEI